MTPYGSGWTPQVPVPTMFADAEVKHLPGGPIRDMVRRGLAGNG